MKTYKRNNVLKVAAPIEGVLGLCRLCLEEAKHGVPIFANKNDICSTISTQIMMCVGYEVTPEDCLPNVICIECNKKLNDYYEFRKKCNRTYHRLKAHLFALQARIADELNEKVEQENTHLIDNTVCPVNPLCAVSETTSQSVDQPLLSLFSQSLISSKDKLVLALDAICNLQFIHLEPGLENGLDINIINSNKLANEAVLNKGVEDNSQELITQPTDVTVCPDVTEFLTSILVEMDVLKNLPDGGPGIGSGDCRTILIETGDSELITLEVQVEEEEQNETTKKIRKTTEKVRNHGTKPQNEVRPSCSVCKRQFASQAVLARHSRVHTGERPFGCAQCGRRFAQREVLRRHELVHIDVRPFACALCPKSFTQRAALAAHARRHEAPDAPRELHRCAACPKVFLHASGLSRHAASHRGRQYLCAACPRRFSDDSSLLRHLRAKHGTPPLLPWV